MRKTKHFLLMAVMLLCSFSVSAYSFKVNGIYYRITSSSELTVGVADAGSGSNMYASAGYTNLVIPETVTYNSNTYSVTSIVSGAFYGCRGLTSLFIPASIKEISTSCWSGSTNNLISIVVDEDNVVYDSRGGCNAVVETNSNTLVLGSLSTAIPPSVTSIGYGAFSYCSSLTSIAIPSSITGIEGNAFSGCSSLTSITIPESVTSIEKGAFKDCNNLTSIVVEDGNTKYDSREGCNAIIHTRIHQLIAGCSSTIIPDNVRSIGEYAFYKCSNLTSITIPSSVASIGNNAFYGCDNISAVYTKDLNAWCNIEFDGSSANPLCHAHSLYLNDELVTELTIPNTVTTVKKYAFNSLGSLTSVTIPSSVTSIEYSAFGGSSLTSVTIPSSVTSIGDYAFSGCSSLTTITIPEDSKLTSIGNHAFYKCSNVTSITIPASVTSIGKMVFYGTTGELFIDCSVAGAQYRNDERDFFGCAFSKIFFGDNARSIGQYAFYDCSSLTSITFSENSKLTSIGNEAFYSCEKLTSIEFPKNLKTISSGAFSGCSNITSITLPSSVTSIGNNAFTNSLELLDVYCYAESVPSTRTDAFDGSYIEYATLHVPISVLENYKATAPWSSFGKFEVLVINVDTIVLNQSTAKLIEGDELILTATITPDDATDKTVTWSSSDPSVATVDNTGKVTAIAPGIATITATVKDGSGVSASCEITVKPASYVITFLIDGEQFFVQTLTRGSTITLPKVPAKEGYTFSGWGEVPETMPAKDVTISGTFIANKYLVTFKIGDEVIATDSLEYGAAIVAPEAPEKEGYSFSGWGKVAETVPANDLTYEGSYSVNSYLLSYTVDGETVQADSVAYGTAITPLIEPVKEGYSFSGWSEIPETMPAEDVQIGGSFTVNSYAITYIIDGEEYQCDTLAYGSVITLPVEPVKEGYSFCGWSELPATMPAGNITVNGMFAVNKYLVTFMVNGVAVVSDSLDYGTPIVPPTMPEREGYSFSGWGDVAETVPACDVTYEGSYIINSYTITYIVDGEEYQCDTLAYGSVITLPVEPVKEGYSFNGWSELPATMPAEDITVSGMFTVNKYLVTFTVDGVAIVSDSLEYGAPIVPPTMPEREGYTFSGWGDVAETVPASDVTYEGSYTANLYNVYYFVGATLVHSVKVAYGEAIPEYIYEPEEEGYTFLGWIGETYASMPAHDVTYTANIDNGIEEVGGNMSGMLIYDLSGRRIINVHNLEKGIYIINGKKVKL